MSLATGPSRASKADLEESKRSTLIVSDSVLKPSGQLKRPSMAGLQAPTSNSLPPPSNEMKAATTSLSSSATGGTTMEWRRPVNFKEVASSKSMSSLPPPKKEIRGPYQSATAESVSSHRGADAVRQSTPNRQCLSMNVAEDQGKKQAKNKKLSLLSKKRTKSIDPNKFVPVSKEEKLRKKDSEVISSSAPSSLSSSALNLPPPTFQPQTSPRKGRLALENDFPPDERPAPPPREPIRGDSLSTSAKNLPHGRPVPPPRNVTPSVLNRSATTPALSTNSDQLQPQPSVGPTKSGSRRGPRSRVAFDESVEEQKAPTRSNRTAMPNKRLSQRLTFQAIAVGLMLEDRKTPEELIQRGILLSSSTPSEVLENRASSTATATWTSRVSVAEEWLPFIEVDDTMPKLVYRDAIKQGFNIETGRKPPSPDSNPAEVEGDRLVMDTDKDVHFFKQLLESAEKIVHYYGDSNDGPVIVTVEKCKDKKFQRALVRGKKGQQRFLISTTGRKGQLKALTNQCPALSSYKLLEVKPEDMEVWNYNLLEYEKKEIINHYKIGVLYCLEGQTTDDEFFNNSNESQEFSSFLAWLGEKVSLKGFDKYRGGLDVKTGTTGDNSIYRCYKGIEIMFHVSTMLPFFPDDKQQVERKRHLGNDVVLVVFKEGNTPFDPDTIHSQFNHVFIVISPFRRNAKGETTHYRIEIANKPGVVTYKPYLIYPGIYPKNLDTLEMLLCKIVNGERAAMYAPDFRLRLARTRKMMLSEIMKGEKIISSKKL